VAGYSRCKGRPSHLCFKTVLASFPAHGSSMTESLSMVRLPLRPTLCNSVFAAEEINLLSSLTPRCCVIRGWTHLLLTALHSQSSSPRQHILWLSQRRWLLGESHPVDHTDDTSSRTFSRSTTGLLRSLSPYLLSVGSYSAPGFVRGVPRS
jgi:hypothetical protein